MNARKLWVLGSIGLLAACGGAGNGTDAEELSVASDAEQLSLCPKGWPMAQNDAQASSDAGLEPKILLPLLTGHAQLAPEWTFAEAQAGQPVGPIHATPVIGHGKVFVGSVQGRFYAIDATTGALAWSITTLAPNPTMGAFFASASPVGTPILGAAALPDTQPYVIFGDTDGNIYCRDAETGAEIWTLKDIDGHRLGGIGGNSLAVVGNVLYAGTASVETFALVLPGGSTTGCCTHVGTLAAIDIRTGAERWRYRTVPSGGTQPLPPERAPFTLGPAGADIWSQPTFDAETNTVFITTGQNLSPNADGSSTRTSDAFIALDAATGAEKWVRQVTSGDVWINGITNPNPTTGQFYDQDIGDSPHLFRLRGRKVVAAGQKSGAFHVVDAKTGALVSSRQVIDQPRALGGFQQAGAHSLGLNFQHGLDRTDAGWDGIVVGLSTDGSRTLWEFRRPNSPMVGGIAVASGVVFVQSPRGEAVAGDPPKWTLYALDAFTGKELLHTDVNGRSVSTPAIADGRIVLGGGNFALGELGGQLAGSVMSFRITR